MRYPPLTQGLISILCTIFPLAPVPLDAPALQLPVRLCQQQSARICRKKVGLCCNVRKGKLEV